MARVAKIKTVETPKRKYTKRAPKLETVKPKYNWKQHVKSKNVDLNQIIIDIPASPNEILDELGLWTEKLDGALNRCKAATGEITTEDISYTVNFILRAMKNKFQKS